MDLLDNEMEDAEIEELMNDCSAGSPLVTGRLERRGGDPETVPFEVFSTLKVPLLPLSDQCTVHNTREDADDHAQESFNKSRPLAELSHVLEKFSKSSKSITGVANHKGLPSPTSSSTPAVKSTPSTPRPLFRRVNTILSSLSGHSSEDREESEMMTASAEQDEDPREQRRLVRRANIIFGVQSLLVITCTAMDWVIIITTWLWSEPDFFCSSPRVAGGTVACGVYDGVRTGNFGIVTFCVSLYTLIFAGRVGSVVRTAGQGSNLFERRRVRVAVILALSYVCLGWHVSSCSSGAPLLVIQRIHNAVNFTRCLYLLVTCIGLGTELNRHLQIAVSLNKRRFQDSDSGFDLDLTYICDRVVAMAIHCVSGAPYRNDIREVARFFAQRHYGRFMVVNLCEDHEEVRNGNYDPSYFYDHVCRIPFFDHNTITMAKLIAFLQDAVDWLNNDPENVIAVHCRGGKGRTGMFCSALCLWTGFSQRVEQAKLYFGRRRTDKNRKGSHLQTVASPSQLRYLRYVKQVKVGREEVLAKATPIVLEKIVVATMPNPAKEKYFVACVVECNGRIEFDCAKAFGMIPVERGIHDEGFDIPVGHVLLQNDVTIRAFYFHQDATPTSQGGGGTTMTSMASMASIAPGAALDAEDLETNKRGELGPGGMTLRYGRHEGKCLFFLSFHTAFVDDRQLNSMIMTFEKDDVDVAYNKKDSAFSPDFEVSLHLWDGDYEELEAPCVRKQHLPHISEASSTRNEARARTASVNTAINNTLQNTLSRRGSSRGSRSPPDPSDARNLPVEKKEPLPLWATNPCLGYMRQRRRVEEIFERESPLITMWKPGDIIFRDSDPIDPDYKFLHLIVKGSGRWKTTNDPREFRFQRSQLAGLDRAVEGDLYCQQTFINGSKPPKAKILRATSTVSIRTIKIRAEGNGVPVEIPGWLPEDCAALFEYVAMRLEQSRTDVCNELVKLKEKEPSKRLLERRSVVTDQHAIASDLAKYLSLPITETHQGTFPISMQGVTIREPDDPEEFNERMQKLTGTLFVFLTCCVFVPEGEGLVLDTCLMFDMSCMARLERRTNKISVWMNQEVGWTSCARHESKFHSISIMDFLRKAKRLFSQRGISRVLNWLDTRNDTKRNFRERTASLRMTRRASRAAASAADDQISLLSRDGFQIEMKDDTDARTFSKLMLSFLSAALDKRRMKLNKRVYAPTDFRYFGYFMDGEDEKASQHFKWWIFNRGVVTCYERGDVIIDPGSQEQALFHIVSGNVVGLSKRGATVVKLGPGEMFGESNMLQTGNTGLTVTFVASDRLHCLVLKAEDLRREDPVNAYASARVYRCLATIVGAQLYFHSDALEEEISQMRKALACGGTGTKSVAR